MNMMSSAGMVTTNQYLRRRCRMKPQINELFIKCRDMLEKFFLSGSSDWYPSSVGETYKDVYRRDVMCSYSFFSSDGTHCYVYFNTAYNSNINRMCFSSVTVVTKQSLDQRVPTIELKQHIESESDMTNFLKVLKTVL